MTWTRRWPGTAAEAARMIPKTWSSQAAPGSGAGARVLWAAPAAQHQRQWGRRGAVHQKGGGQLVAAGVGVQGGVVGLAGVCG